MLLSGKGSPLGSSAVEMEAASRLGALQKLRERLCRETEPRKLYKTLKKLSSLPDLCDTLAEIDFKQTIRLLWKQQLLVPYAKDLAARWSERSQLGPQPEPDPTDFAFQGSLMTEAARNPPEDKARGSASREPRGEGTEVLEVSPSSPGPRRRPSPRPEPRRTLSTHPSPARTWATRSPRLEPRGSKRPRVSFGNPEPAAQSQVRVAKPRGRAGEPWRLQGCKPLSGQPEARPEKERLSPPRERTPGHGIQEEHQAGSCLDSDSSPPSSAPALLLPTRCKRRRKSTCKAEALCPEAKLPRGKSASRHPPNGSGFAAGSPLAEDAWGLHAGFPLDGQEHSSLYTDQEGPTWACRKNLKTPLCSGPAWLPENTQQGGLAEPDCPRETHRQGAVEGTEPWQQEGESSPQTHIGKPTHTQSEKAKTVLPLQESLELRLQALRARLQAARAKKPQGRQTKMLIAFHAQATSSGQQAESGPGGAASSETHSLQEGSGPRLTRSAPCQRSSTSSGGSNGTRPKRPAPLMAKTIRDYKKSLLWR